MVFDVPTVGWRAATNVVLGEASDSPNSSRDLCPTTAPSVLRTSGITERTRLPSYRHRRGQPRNFSVGEAAEHARTLQTTSFSGRRRSSGG